MYTGRLLKEAYPEIFSQINIEETLKIYPNLDIENIGARSHLNLYWNCEKGHVYRLNVMSRTRNDSGCPECHKNSNSSNLLKDRFPDIFSQINKEETLKLYPNLDFNSLTSYSERKIMWNCPNGHVYPQIIGNKTRKGYTCPYCSNRQLLIGYNDLETFVNNHPEYQYILEEWDYSQNILKPSEVLYISKTKYWWICKHGHNYQQSLSCKIHMNEHCPKCANKTSIPQILFYELIKKYVDKNVVLNFKTGLNKNKNIPWEIDIYIPSLNICLEYDGIWYHTSEISVNRDIRKNEDLSKNYTVIRIKETDDISKLNKNIKENNAINVYITEKRVKDYFLRINSIFKELFDVVITVEEIKKKYREIQFNKELFFK